MNDITIEMHEPLDIFSTRQLALLIWMVVFIACALLFIKGTREPFFGLVKAIFSKKILIHFTFLIAYVSVAISVLYFLSFWNRSLIKDSVFWFFSFAIITFFHINDAKGNRYFGKILRDSFKWTIFVEFLVNFYTFSLVTELIMLPLIIIVVTLKAVSEGERKYDQVSKLLKIILSLIGMVYLSYAFFKTINNYNNILAASAIKAFMLPLLLTIWILPYFYFTALYMRYEELFKIIDFRIPDNSQKERIRMEIFNKAGLSLNKVLVTKQHLNKLIL